MKKYNEEKVKKIIYSTCALTLCGVTLFSFWLSNKDNIPTEDLSNTSTTTETTTEKEVKVNTPVTNVADDRYTTTTTEEAPKAVFYSFPLGDKISKAYSNGELTKNKTTDDWRSHNGVDIAGNQGDEIKAICDGEVTEIKEDALWGTVVTINHNNGIVAVYSGLQKDSTLKPGDTVKANEKIGLLGEIPIEKDDGIHLHLEIMKDGNAVSPSDYLGKSVDI